MHWQNLGFTMHVQRNVICNSTSKL